jgi:hypothetical protein
MKTKFTLILGLAFMVLLPGLLFAGKKEVKFTASEPDAMIYVNNKFVSKGQFLVTVLSDACVIVRVEKPEFLIGTVEFCNKQNVPAPPKTYYLQMEKDDSHEASEASDVANIDLEIKTTKSEVEAWKLLSQIITSYFDVIEVTDKETGYLRTAWVIQSFKQRTVRTRIIIKLGSSDPLTYKIKLISEYASGPQISAKSDELFREWDRVLRKYREVIREVQTRLGS